MNNWIFLVLSKNPKKNPPIATIGPVTLLFPLFAAHTHCLVPIHSYDPARPVLLRPTPGHPKADPCWGHCTAVPRPTTGVVTRPALVRVFPVLFSLCPCTTREREREGERATTTAVLAAPLSCSPTKRRRRRGRRRSCELWSCGARVTTACDCFERHRSCLHMSWKFAIAFEQGRGAFVSFQNHFYALEKKKAFEEESSVGCRK